MLKKNLVIFCGARFPKLAPDELEKFKSEIADMIKQLSSHYNLVYGGGHVGLMGFVADCFLENGGHVTGVIPEYLNTVEIQHRGVSETEVVDDLHQRKASMEKRADAYLVLPGGIGTLDELCEVLTLQSLSRHDKLIYILNWQNLFDGFFQFVKTATQKGFISETLLNQCVITPESSELVKKLL